MRIYEYAPQEIGELLPFRNATFSPLSLEQWLAMDCTGIVAREGGALVGFIPLQYRQQCLNPQASIPVVYENAVGVAPERRGQGIGTQMMDAGARFMADRVDALFVIRGGERSQGYRFYRKSGHSDLVYACWYYLEPEVSWSIPGVSDEAGISLLQREEWLALEPQLLALYHSQYGRYGGGRLRAPGYWAAVLDGHVFAGRKWWLVTLAGDAGRLRGYMVAAQGTWSSERAVCVYEVVGEDEATVMQLLRYGRGLARHTGGFAQYIVPLVSLANPIRPLLRRLGFAEGESGPQVMARLLRPDRIWKRLAAGSDLVQSLALAIATPHRVVQVSAPPDARHCVRLETKEHCLARLFTCRLDLEAAVEMELVRWREPDPGLRRELAHIFAPCEWVQWYTDYV
jgi:GNAT superfamily N-acetyltransferase